MWREVLSWEVEQDFQVGDVVSINPRAFPTMPIREAFSDNVGIIQDIHSGDSSQFWVLNSKGLRGVYVNSGYLTLAHRPKKRVRTSLQKVAATPLTVDDIARKVLDEGDYVTPNQTFKTSNTDTIIFTKGKDYPVLEYSNFAVGLLVQSDIGPWTITFTKDGIGSYFSWRKPTQEEQVQTTLETNPLITDILNVVATPGSYPRTVQQTTEQVQQIYTSEGGTMSPKDFATRIAVAWGKAFHLGFVAMVRNSDKVSITPEGRKYLES